MTGTLEGEGGEPLSTRSIFFCLMKRDIKTMGPAIISQLLLVIALSFSFMDTRVKTLGGHGIYADSGDDRFTSGHYNIDTTFCNIPKITLHPKDWYSGTLL